MNIISKNHLQCCIMYLDARHYFMTIIIKSTCERVFDRYYNINYNVIGDMNWGC